MNLIDCLEDLLALHRKLKLRLKLSDVLREDKRDIAVLVLDWCDQMEEIERVAEGFLAEYLTRFEINSSDFYAGKFCILLSSLTRKDCQVVMFHNI